MTDTIGCLCDIASWVLSDAAQAAETAGECVSHSLSSPMSLVTPNLASKGWHVAGSRDVIDEAVAIGSGRSADALRERRYQRGRYHATTGLRRNDHRASPLRVATWGLGRSPLARQHPGRQLLQRSEPVLVRPRRVPRPRVELSTGGGRSVRCAASRSPTGAGRRLGQQELVDQLAFAGGAQPPTQASQHPWAVFSVGSCMPAATDRRQRA